MIRREAATTDDDHTFENYNHDGDKTGSLFSAALNALNMSLRSNMSTGSAGSILTVISIKSSNSTSFSISGADETYQHKSKFNQIGKQKKKKNYRERKKNKGKSNKIRPGSKQELQHLVGTLQSSCVDAKHCSVLSDTVLFLFHIGELGRGRALYDCYCKASNLAEQAQTERIEAERQRKLEEERRVRREGGTDPCHQSVTGATAALAQVEKNVDSLSWAPLPKNLHDFFSYLPTNVE